MNAFTTGEAEDVPVLKVDNARVRRVQIERLEHLRAARDPKKVEEALAAMTRAAAGSENLLELAIVAARSRATVGEMSLALEKVFGRHQAVIRAVRGVYARAMLDPAKLDHARALTARFLEREGRRPRILLAKMGQDGHDRGQKVMATGLSDVGFDVDIGPLFQTPEEVAQQAVDNDVHIVGVSSLAAGHMTLVPLLRDALARLGKPDAVIVVGGVVPPEDIAPLHSAGAALVFGPGTVVVDAAVKLVELLLARPLRVSDAHGA